MDDYRRKVHICPIKGCTVLFENKICQEHCKESDYPVIKHIDTRRQE